MRSDVQDASLRIQQYAQSHHEKDTALGVTTFQICKRSHVLPSADFPVPQGSLAPDVRLAIQHIDKPDLRGTINAMARLIEEHGIAELQRVGVLSQEGGLRSQEITVVAKTYGIPVHDATLEENGSNAGSSHKMALGMGQLALDPQLNAAYAHPAWQDAIRFPTRDHMDIIHGHGTLALEFERALATPAQDSSGRPYALKSFPDFVICDMDSGINLSGICMAFAGTGVRVMGAAPKSGFWEHAARQYLANMPPEEMYEHKYWEGIDVPMAAIPWGTFREPGHLSAVLEVDNEQMSAACMVARENFGLHLDPDEVVPLAVALYNQDLQRLVSQAWDEDHEPTVGVMLRSRRGEHLVPVSKKAG